MIKIKRMRGRVQLINLIKMTSLTDVSRRVRSEENLLRVTFK
jgi:hypothetical protein